jgi:hypothetical protein
MVVERQRVLDLENHRTNIKEFLARGEREPGKLWCMKRLRIRIVLSRHRAENRSERNADNRTGAR